MATFVLDPPPGVRVVSFFVTARFAGQADRVAFCNVLLEQLLEILDESKPAYLTDVTLEAHLLGALARAAQWCRNVGERLVLVVDGLDEDQGVTSGPESHSIAALLPVDPPAGMSVIVASRPNPALPPDVHVRHPLRDPSVVRELIPSAHAGVIRNDAERELKRLLRGEPADLDLLGLISAAGGGLSSDDLAHLTGMLPWEVEERLGAVTGRTFTPRAGYWQPETVVFVLGHEELQQQAVHYIGLQRLTIYRESLHPWADSYRHRGWPAETPDFLFRGYFRLLRSTGDLRRVLALATDHARHNRMLDLVGGDTSALDEVATAQEMYLSAGAPDLVAMSSLSAQRVILERRNDGIPDKLPVVWTMLGRVNRAEALARSITGPSRGVRAFVGMIRQLVDAGDLESAKAVCHRFGHSLDSIGDLHESVYLMAWMARSCADTGDSAQAVRLLHQAQSLLKSHHGSSDHPRFRAALAQAWAVSGEIATARNLVSGIASLFERSQALVSVVAEASRRGYFETARQIAGSLSGRGPAAEAWAVIAKSMAATGDLEAASSFMRRSAEYARKVGDPRTRARAFASAADAAEAVGLRDEARALLDQAESAVFLTTRTSDGDDARERVARSLAAVGERERADALVRAITNPKRRVKGMAAIASGLATGNVPDQAESYAMEAETAARSLAQVEDSHTLADLSRAALGVGSLPLAEQIARSISESGQRDRVLTAIVQALAAADAFDRAEETTRDISDPQQRDTATTLIVQTAMRKGKRERADRLALLIGDADKRHRALRLRPEKEPIEAISDAPTSIAVKENTGNPLAAAADIIASKQEIYPQAEALTSLARRVAMTGDINVARSIIELIANVQLRARAYVNVAHADGQVHPSVARALLDDAVATATTISDPKTRYRCLGTVAEGLARFGDIDRAEQLARTAEPAPEQVKLLTSIAKTAARQGAYSAAESIAMSIGRLFDREPIRQPSPSPCRSDGYSTGRKHCSPSSGQAVAPRTPSGPNGWRIRCPNERCADKH